MNQAVSAESATSHRRVRVKVDVTFTDETGRRWEVHGFAVIAKFKRTHGERAAEYRGFYCRATGERRVYHFVLESEDRSLAAVD